MCGGPLTPIASTATNITRFNEVSDLIAARRLGYKDFEPIQEIGKGGFGVVELVRHKRTRAVYAIKTMSKAHLLTSTVSELMQFWEERYIMVHATSPWLISCHSAFMVSSTSSRLVFAVGGGVGGGAFTCCTLW